MKTIVNQTKSKLPKTSLIFGVILLVIIICIAINPAKYSAIAFNGLSVWAKVLVPSLLPFFILTKILLGTGIVDSICRVFAPLTKKLYNCPPQGAYVFFMSIITGYPVGSKLVADLYNSRQITRQDAIKLTSFCSTSGPMFILGTVAIGMFANAKMGYILLISHILGALINGIFYRNINIKNNVIIQNNNTKNKNNLLSEFSNKKNQKTLKNQAFQEQNNNKNYSKILNKLQNNKILNNKKIPTELKDKSINFCNEINCEKYNSIFAIDNSTQEFHNDNITLNKYLPNKQIATALEQAKYNHNHLALGYNENNSIPHNGKTNIKNITNNIQQNSNPQSFDFSQSIISSISSILLIGGVVCFAFVILEVITSSKFFLSIINLLRTAELDGNLITSVFCGLCEITKGCLMLSSTLISTKLATLIACFVISFGGISTFLQGYAFLKNIVPAKTFLLQKFTHAICSLLVCSIILLIV